MRNSNIEKPKFKIPLNENNDRAPWHISNSIIKQSYEIEKKRK
jgi:hypothetical protein